MKKKHMRLMALITGIVCLALAVVIFIFAEGLRRWYSTIFFALMGIVMFINALRWKKEAADKS